MTDRELLELAAKASGVDPDRLDGIQYMTSTWPPRCEISIWNPLIDDGDALRLAVKLKLCVDIYPYFAAVKSESKNFIGTTCRFDKCGGAEAATRRAIVRAAAEIGRGMV